VKQTIKLKESQLTQIIKESVMKVLNEKMITELGSSVPSKKETKLEIYINKIINPIISKLLKTSTLIRVIINKDMDIIIRIYWPDNLDYNDVDYRISYNLDTIINYLNENINNGADTINWFFEDEYEYGDIVSHPESLDLHLKRKQY